MGRIVLLALVACGDPASPPATPGPEVPDPVASSPVSSTSETEASATEASASDDGWGTLDADLVARLEAALEQAPAAASSPGVALAVVDVGAHAMWVGAAGDADTAAGRPWTPDLPYAIGSVSKTFTTALVMQLVDEGQVDLDAPLDAWGSHPWEGAGITVRHLVAHTSGIPSYNYVGGFDSALDYTPEELVEWAGLYGPDLDFAPGTDWAYTNTGFVLLGLIVEEATGLPLEQALQERLLDPLALSHTSLPAAFDDELVRGYELEEGVLVDATDTATPSMGWAAGGMQATPADVAAWGAALFGGQVVSEARLAEMTTPLVLDGEEVGYGLGLFGGVDPDWGGLWGHTGGISGHLTYLFWLAEADTVVVAMVNSFEGDLDAAAELAWIEVLGSD